MGHFSASVNFSDASPASLSPKLASAASYAPPTAAVIPTLFDPTELCFQANSSCDYLVPSENDGVTLLQYSCVQVIQYVTFDVV